MEFLDGNTKLFSFEDAVRIKRLINTKNNLNAITQSTNKDVIYELFSAVVSGDNYTEAWGGFNLEDQSWDEYLQSKMHEKVAIYKDGIFGAYELLDCFLIDICLPVLDILISNNMISVNGYRVNTFSNSDLIGLSVSIKKRVKREFFRKRGIIKNVAGDEFIIEIDNDRYSFKKDGFLFNLSDDYTVI